MRSSYQLFVFCLTTCLAAAYSGCDEALPPRDTPAKYLEAQCLIAEGAVEVRDSVAVGLAGEFVIQVKNIYSEVLQDDEFARAEIDVWLRDMPEKIGKAIATKRHLTDPSLVQAGQLTLQPNVTATFLFQWEHKTDSGRYFWEFSDLHFVPSPNTNGYWETDPLHFVAKGRVQLFRTRAPEFLKPIEFTLVYRLWEQ